MFSEIGFIPTEFDGSYPISGQAIARGILQHSAML